MLLLAITLSVAHSVDTWAFTECTVAETGSICNRMVAMPMQYRDAGNPFLNDDDDILETSNILMCCDDIAPYYLLNMRGCYQSVWLTPATAQCAAIVLADAGTMAWCCAETEQF